MGDKYRLERLLGQGEMGCVYLAQHVVTGESLGLKLVQPTDPSQGPNAFAAFRAAARAAARFRSEHVAHVRDIGLLEDGSVFLVMEHLEGETLAEHLRARRELPIGLAVDLALQAVRGLGDAHAAGVIHRDAKPSNWFLARTPDGSLRVKMLDFGRARIHPRTGGAQDSPTTGSGAVGTRPYAAPEQVRSSSDVDERADIWTIGVVLYEMLRNYAIGQARDSFTGSPPSLRATQNGISPELEAVVLRCLAKRPEGRFRDMGELASALASLPAAEAAASTSSVPPPPELAVDPPPAMERTQEPKAWPRRPPGVRLVAAVGAVCVAIGAVLLFAAPSVKPNASLAAPNRETVTVSAVRRPAEAPDNPDPSSPLSASAPVATITAAEAPADSAPPSYLPARPSSATTKGTKRGGKPAPLPPAANVPALRAPPVGTAGFGDRQ